MLSVLVLQHSMQLTAPILSPWKQVFPMLEELSVGCDMLGGLTVRWKCRPLLHLAAVHGVWCRKSMQDLIYLRYV